MTCVLKFERAQVLLCTVSNNFLGSDNLYIRPRIQMNGRINKKIVISRVGDVTISISGCYQHDHCPQMQSLQAQGPVDEESNEINKGDKCG